MKARVGSYGAEDRYVREWLGAQDVVFQNCSGGSTIPNALGPESPSWLRKDRDYQIAASYFYSLQLDEARQRFQQISEDVDSDWQDMADYLVNRTLVRQASLTEKETDSRRLYEEAEVRLVNSLAHAGKLLNATRKLLALVKYRIHPEERTRELAAVLANESGNDNFRQDLIDYGWLLDKFDEQIRKAEEERKKKELGTREPENTWKPDPVIANRNKAVERGELIEISFTPLDEKHQYDYRNYKYEFFKPDATLGEITQVFELALARKLSADEVKEIVDRRESALYWRKFKLSPNRKLNQNEYEGCYECNEMPFHLLPEFLKADDLSDWILTMQSKDPLSFDHALKKYRQLKSNSWFIAAIAKAPSVTPQVNELMKQAGQMEHESPAFPTVAYHLIRLNLLAGRESQAKELLDTMISFRFESLPVSSQNLFLKERTQLTSSIDEFLHYSARKPVAFLDEGVYGTLADLLRLDKWRWGGQYSEQTKEDFDKETEKYFEPLMPWSDRSAFDDETVDVFNWHFPTTKLVEAARSSAVPDYLQREFAIAAWTRAVVLKNHKLAKEVTPDLIKLAPEMTELLREYESAQSQQEQDDMATWVLLKSPKLSPLVSSGFPDKPYSDKDAYYLESAWWCPPSDTEYNSDGAETLKKVPAPSYLPSSVLAAAKKEREAIRTLGDPKSVLGKQALAWAKRAPEDPRIPEILYLTVKANERYKYGCNSWENDEDTWQQAKQLLRERYAGSSWAAKLAEDAEDEDP